MEAAKLVAADVAGIDVNAGCPKAFSTSGGMGAALLQTPELLASILMALVNEIGKVYGIGISVKIRLLETPEKTEVLVRRLCQTGIVGLTVHCRTTPMRPRERAIRDQLRMIADVCRGEGVACLMNGDVKNKDEARRLAKEYGADGAMIATAAESNPSCFRTAEEGGLLPWQQVVTEYMKTALEVDNKFGNTKFLLSQLMPGKEQVNRKLVGARSYVDLCARLDLPELHDLATEVDGRLGITTQEKGEGIPAAKKAITKNKSVQAAAGKMGRETKIDASAKSPLSERRVAAPSTPVSATTPSAMAA